MADILHANKILDLSMMAEARLYCHIIPHGDRYRRGSRRKMNEVQGFGVNACLRPSQGVDLQEYSLKCLTWGSCLM